MAHLFNAHLPFFLLNYGTTNSSPTPPIVAPFAALLPALIGY